MRRAVVTRGGSALLSAVVIAVAVVGCGGSEEGDTSTAASGSTSGGQLTFNTWGGAYQEAQMKAIVEPFRQETGTKVNVTQPIDYAKLKSMVDTGNVVWDVADVEPYVSRRGCKEGWLEKLDYNVIDPNGFLETMPKTDCSVPNGAFGLPIAYRTDKWKDAHPRNWAEFFDTKKFPGKRSMPKYAESGILEAALLADGVKKDALYPLDADRAFRKLDTIKKDIVFWESGDQSEQLMNTGEVTLCACWATRMHDTKVNQDTPVAIEWQDAIYGWDDFVVPKGAKNLKAAMEFINYGTHPDREIGMTKYTPWGPSRTEAAANADPETRDWVPTTPEHTAIGVPLDYDWWGENAAKLDEQFAQWLLK